MQQSKMYLPTGANRHAGCQAWQATWCKSKDMTAWSLLTQASMSCLRGLERKRRLCRQPKQQGRCAAV